MAVQSDFVTMYAIFMYILQPYACENPSNHVRNTLI